MEPVSGEAPIAADDSSFATLAEEEPPSGDPVEAPVPELDSTADMALSLDVQDEKALAEPEEAGAVATSSGTLSLSPEDFETGEAAQGEEALEPLSLSEPQPETPEDEEEGPLDFALDSEPAGVDAPAVELSQQDTSLATETEPSASRDAVQTPDWSDAAFEASTEDAEDDDDLDIELPLVSNAPQAEKPVRPSTVAAQPAPPPRAVALAGDARVGALLSWLERVVAGQASDEPSLGMHADALGRVAVRMLLKRGILNADDVIELLAVPPERLTARIAKVLHERTMLGPDDLVSMIALSPQGMNAAMVRMLLSRGHVSAADVLGAEGHRA